MLAQKRRLSDYRASDAAVMQFSHKY